MTRTRLEEEILGCDPEIDRTLRAIRRERKHQEHDQENPKIRTMADNNDRLRLLRDYGALSVQGFQPSVTRPIVEANNFELKPAWLQMIQQTQFGGSPTKDPHYHLQCFLALCDTFKMNGVSDQSIRLRAFPFSLQDRARKWLLSHPVRTFTT